MHFYKWLSDHHIFVLLFQCTSLQEFHRDGICCDRSCKWGICRPLGIRFFSSFFWGFLSWDSCSAHVLVWLYWGCILDLISFAISSFWDASAPMCETARLWNLALLILSVVLGQILVRYRGALPDLFREGHSVVAEGFVRPFDQYPGDLSTSTDQRANLTAKAKESGCYFAAIEVLAKHDEVTPC